MKNQKLLKGYALVMISALLFGCMPLITTFISREGISRESVVLMRNMLALPLLGLLSWRQSKSVGIPLKTLPAIGAIALMGCCITPLLLYSSYQHIATGTATVFHFIYPAVVVIIGLMFQGKKISKGTLCAVLICVLGIALFYNPADPLDWTGCSLALASGVTYAVYVVLLSGFQYKEVTGFKLSFYVSAICTVVMLAVCLATNKLTLPTTGMGWLLSILLALVINVGAVVMFQKGTFHIGGERASVLSTLEPLTGVIVGVAVFSEKITAFAAVGAALVILACILIAVADVRKK